MKAICVAEWRETGTRLRRVPFRAWFLHVLKKKRLKESQDVIISAYHRRKTRLLISGVFRMHVCETATSPSLPSSLHTARTLLVFSERDILKKHLSRTDARLGECKPN